MFTNKQYQQAIQNAAVDALTTGTGVMSQGVIAGGLTASNHAADAYSYTINNTANQTLNSVQIGAQKQNHNIVFHGPNGKEIGRFDFNGEELKFDGKADTSAQVFVEWARRQFNDRALADKRDVLKLVVDALVHESTGSLYEDAEKLAILTCIQRVREIQMLVEPIQKEMWENAQVAKQAVAPLQPLAPWSNQP